MDVLDKKRTSMQLKLALEWICFASPCSQILQFVFAECRMQL